MIVLGLNVFHADTSAVLMINNKCVSAIEEERFTRIKHFTNIPINSIKFCLESNKLKLSDVDYITVNYNSLYNFKEKIMFSLKNINKETLKKILFINKKKNLRKYLEDKFLLKIKAKIIFVPHHYSHISSSYFYSGFSDALGITIDGSGDFSTMETYLLEGKQIKIIDKSIYPNSLGIFYQAFTQFLGFDKYGDEYKVMALAGYGRKKYINKVKKVIKYDEKGKFNLDLDYFTHHKVFPNYDYKDGRPRFGRLYSNKLIKLFGKNNKNRNKISVKYQDIAASMQHVFEEVILNKLTYLKKKYNKKKLVTSGGCFFNTKLNGILNDSKLFSKIHINANVGDAGGALGSASYFLNSKNVNFKNIRKNNIFLGPSYSNSFIDKNIIKKFNLNKSATINFKYYNNFSSLTKFIAKELAKDKIVGWFQDRSEFSPRALGNRSLLANPSNPNMRKIINLKIKKREKFRPFGASILSEFKSYYFENSQLSPAMNLVFKVKSKIKKKISSAVHIDSTTRVQTVSKNDNEKFYNLIKEFYKIKKIPMLINTSFNVDEPIVNNPLEAYETFCKTNIDILVLQNFILTKKNL